MRMCARGALVPPVTPPRATLVAPDWHSIWDLGKCLCVHNSRAFGREAWGYGDGQMGRGGGQEVDRQGELVSSTHAVGRRKPAWRAKGRMPTPKHMPPQQMMGPARPAPHPAHPQPPHPPRPYVYVRCMRYVRTERPADDCCFPAGEAVVQAYAAPLVIPPDLAVAVQGGAAAHARGMGTGTGTGTAGQGRAHPSRRQGWPGGLQKGRAGSSP